MLDGDHVEWRMISTYPFVPISLAIQFSFLHVSFFSIIFFYASRVRSFYQLYSTSNISSILGLRHTNFSWVSRTVMYPRRIRDSKCEHCHQVNFLHYSCSSGLCHMWQRPVQSLPMWKSRALGTHLDAKSKEDKVSEFQTELSANTRFRNVVLVYSSS